jgi:hypothetical protein
MIRSTEKFNDLTGNRTRDFPTCSLVPQLTTLPRAHEIISLKTLQSQQSHSTIPKTYPLQKHGQEYSVPCMSSPAEPFFLHDTVAEDVFRSKTVLASLQELVRCPIFAMLHWITWWGCGVACPIALDFHLPGNLKVTAYSEKNRNTMHV